MSNPDDPFRPPESNLQGSDDPLVLGHLVRRPLSHGLQWYQDGWGLFRAAPGTWIGMVLVYVLIMMVASSIPVLSLLATIMAPVFGGGFMIACRNAQQNGVLNFGDLFAGFQTKLGPLLQLGLIILGCWFALSLLLVAMIVSQTGADFENMEDPELLMGALGANLAILVFLMVPIMMGQWFSPALVVLHDVSPFSAFKASLSACFKNLPAFLLYLVIGFVLSLLATLPMMLGWLLLLPVIMTSTYAGYQDMFSVQRRPAGIT